MLVPAMKIILLVLSMLILPVCAFAEAPLVGQMPSIATHSLSKNELTLPRDLPGEKTLALIAFARAQQVEIDTWVSGMKLDAGDIAWVELPVVGKRNFLMKGVINGGMRSGITSKQMRDRTITLFTDPKILCKAMGLSKGTNTIYAAVVDRSGVVLGWVDGPYNKDGAARIQQLLAPSNSTKK
jgi:hypothetical protein